MPHLGHSACHRPGLRDVFSSCDVERRVWQMITNWEKKSPESWHQLKTKGRSYAIIALVYIQVCTEKNWMKGSKRHFSSPSAPLLVCAGMRSSGHWAFQGCPKYICKNCQVAWNLGSRYLLIGWPSVLAATIRPELVSDIYCKLFCSLLSHFLWHYFFSSENFSKNVWLGASTCVPADLWNCLVTCVCIVVRRISADRRCWCASRYDGQCISIADVSHDRVAQVGHYLLFGSSSWCLKMRFVVFCRQSRYFEAEHWWERTKNGSKISCPILHLVRSSQCDMTSRWRDRG